MDLLRRSVRIKIMKALHRRHRVKGVVGKAGVLGAANAKGHPLAVPLSRQLTRIDDLVFRNIGHGKACAGRIKAKRQHSGTAAQIQDLLTGFADAHRRELLVEAFGINIAAARVTRRGPAEVEPLTAVDI